MAETSPPPPTQTKECDLCGGMMKMKTREEVLRIPGLDQYVKRVVREWECPECSCEEEIVDEG